jgi:EpsI family protein
MIPRALIVLVLLTSAGLAAVRTHAGEVAVSREQLSELPYVIAGWTGVDMEPLSDDILAQVGVDDYTSRQYLRSDGATAVNVYVGYYASQRQGDTIHSPMNCLPGAGWQPIETARQTITAGETRVEVNRYVISKGLSRQVVLYWYQGRGRVVASEYAHKAWLMVDAARLGRTNGGLVRLIVPVTTTVDAATEQVTTFATALVPHLARYLP